ncbi:hypothetical protein I6M48_02865 [Shewanella algae]|uniref:hypothetical protein n=1 Tax=Shewanella algae TaxID=38313 RepID=UPI001AAE2763|nr:hypothetical protein [Shewanella algae]MBO2631446.1 hypothetical protein [Shewanella algae]
MQLQQGYLGEIYGMAFFERLGRDYHSQVTESQLTASQLTEIHLTESQAVFSLLFKVEQYTAKALLKLLPELASLDEALLEQVRMQALERGEKRAALILERFLGAL